MQGAPDCDTEKVCPAIVSVPERGLVLALAVTYQVTVPLALPLAGAQVSQVVALLEAVQLQLPLAVRDTVPLPAP